jgi:hypothetical protein
MDHPAILGVMIQSKDESASVTPWVYKLHEYMLCVAWVEDEKHEYSVCHDVTLSTTS